MDGFEAFAHLFVGRDPLALAAHARTLETISFHAGRYWPLEAALWDLAGRALGVPVATLLGGAADRLPVYASLGELRSPGQRAEDARALVARGFRAVKVRIARDRIPEGVAVVAAIRDAVGDALEIMVDLNQWWRMPGDIAPGLDPQAARRVIDALAEHGVLWVEEPLAGDDLSGMRMLRGAPGSRIAGGEMARRFDELRRRWSAAPWTCSSPTSCWRWASPGRARSPTWRCGATAGSPPTPGPTGSACWPTCTSAAASAAARTSSSPTTPGLDPGAPRLHARRSRCGSTPTAGWPSDAPGLGIELDEEAVARYALRGLHRRPFVPRRRRPDVRHRLSARRHRDRPVARGAPRTSTGPWAPRRRAFERGDWASPTRPPAAACWCAGRADDRASGGARAASRPATPAIRSATPAASMFPTRRAALPGTARRSTRSTARSRRPPPMRWR